MPGLRPRLTLREARVQKPLRDVARRFSARWGILMLFCISGCAWNGSTTLPTPQYSSVTVRLRSDSARRLQEHAERRASSSAVARLISLPNGLEPPVASRPWKYIVLHHTATARGDVATIDAEHRNRTDAQGTPWLGIGYHFVIGNGRGMDEGSIEPTFRWTEQLHGAHAGSRPHNDLGIGICLVGNFENEPPTVRQIAAVKRLVRDLSHRYGIRAEDVLRHGDIKATDCPGEQFPFDEVVDVLRDPEPEMVQVGGARVRIGRGSRERLR